MTRESSMVGRVTRSVLLATLVGSVVGSLFAVVALDALVAGAADQRLRAATDTLTLELDEERREADKDSLDEILDDENSEISTSGITLAVYDGPQIIAGDPHARLSPENECATRQRKQETVRVCAKSYGRWRLVAVQADGTSTWRKWFLLSVLVSLGLGTLVALLLSRRLSSWAVQPLTELSRRLSRVRAQDQGVHRVGAVSGDREIREVQEAMDALLERVEGLMEQSKRFATDAAHELLTPLAVLKTELELLAEAALLAETEQEEGVPGSATPVLAGPMERVEGLQRLVESLLVLASDEATLRAAFQPVSVDEAVTDVVDALPKDARARILWTRGAEGLVLGEPSLLRSAVSNALSNALKFAQKGSIEITLSESSGEVTLVVSDQGPGVPPEQRTRVLDPFYRALADTTPGHGIGLALIAHIARAHGGEVRFEEAERGARLVMSFPGWEDPAA